MPFKKVALGVERVESGKQLQFCGCGCNGGELSSSIAEVMGQLKQDDDE